MAEAEELQRMWRVHRTCWEMLQERRYLVPDEKLTMTFDAFNEEFGPSGEAFRESMTIVVPKIEDPQQQLIVFFNADEKLGVKKLTEYIDRLKEDQIDRCILVLQKKLSGPANTERMLVRNSFVIEDFLETELLVNITKHVMVPKHTILSDEDKQNLLIRYKVKETQLPRIQLSDPVAKFLGMQRGQVVRIVRPSETAGRYVTYRYCI